MLKEIKKLNKVKEKLTKNKFLKNSKSKIEFQKINKNITKNKSQEEKSLKNLINKVPEKKLIKVEKKQIIIPEKIKQAEQKTTQQSTDYKSLVPHKQPEIKITPKEIKKLRITEAKIKKMLNVEHLEELFYIINLLDNKQISLFIKHYKNSEIEKSKDQRIDSIIRNAKNSFDLIKTLKKELATQLSEELGELKTNISEINKGGIDTYMESIKVMSIPLKIGIFLATGKREDFYKIKKMLSAIKDTLKPKQIELEKIKKQKEEREKSFDKIEKQKNKLNQEDDIKKNPPKKIIRKKQIKSIK